MIDFLKLRKKNQRDKSTLYCFLHIPKTSGTSIREQILADYETHEVFNFYNQPVRTHYFLNENDFFKKKEKYSEEELRSVRVLIGHSISKNMALSFNRPVRYLAFIREPTERVLSLYYHYLRIRYRRLEKPMSEIEGMDCKILLDDFNFWFSQIHYNQSLAGIFSNFINQKRKYEMYDEGAILDEARQAFESFDHIGLTSEKESYLEIKSILNLSKEVGFLNVGHYQKDQNFHDAIRVKVLERWPLDVLLYEELVRLKTKNRTKRLSFGFS